MEQCILVHYRQRVFDILHHLLTHMFIHCSYKCRPTAAELNKGSQIGVQLEDGTKVLCRNFVALLPDHMSDVTKDLKFGTHHYVCLISRNGII
jgi:hypothetical protein